MSKKRKFVGFIAITIAMFMGMLDSTIVNIALPDITAYFHSKLNDTSWISTVYVMGLAVFTITASKLADQFGRKKLMVIGLILFGGSSALCSLTHSLGTLIVMRLFQSLGGAIIMPIVIPMGFEIFGKDKLRSVGGAVGAVTAMAAASGPPIGGLLIKYINWQSIFFVNVPFSVIALLLVLLFVGESYDTTVDKKIDWLGMLLLTSTLFLLTFALLKGNDYGWGSAVIVCMLVGSAAALVLFIIAEKKVKSPMVEFSLFSEPTFTASTICCLLTGFGISSPILIFSYFLQNALGYEPLNAALIIMTVALTVIVSMPLGTFIAAKLGAKLVNFLGLLGMAAGVYLLSRLTVDTPKIDMIAEMAVCGFGLGFACQSIISAVKYLPAEKSGIGSGIVNAARQIGICLGIALLVSFLSGNVKASTNNFKSDSITAINKSGIADSLKAAMIADISRLNSTDYSSSGQQDLQNKLETDITNAAAALSQAPEPADATLAMLYDAVSSLQDGTEKALDGQTKLDSGIDAFKDGLDSLYSGSQSLSAQLGKLSDGLSKTLSGAQTLDASSRDGLQALITGINQASSGANQLLSQLSSGTDAKNPTVYDGVTAISGGTQALSANIDSYITATDTTLFLMIKNDPSSPQLLSGYQASLTKAMTDYAKASDAASKSQLELQIQSLTNLVNLYTAGTDSAVSNVQQFVTKLAAMAKQSASGASLVSSGAALSAGAQQLVAVSKQFAAVFSAGGSFKSGMTQLAQGLALINQNSGDLVKLQGGVDTLSGTLAQLGSGAQQLMTGSEKIVSGLSDAVKNSEALKSGSSQLLQGDADLSSGASKLMTGVGLAGQQSEITSVVSGIKKDKDNMVAGAFDKTFLFAAIILTVTSGVGLFTDRKRKDRD
jgi:EmrB/QacA subfamily drug resistance transporter